MTYAVVEMILRVAEYFPCGWDLFVFLILVSISIHVPFLVYIQNGRFELL
jgi:hypothetical protein